jgi:DNA-binding NarL/FixJ family response regulator
LEVHDAGTPLFEGPVTDGRHCCGGACVINHMDASDEQRSRTSPSWYEGLTSQELQVAIAIANGESNKEAAATLFVSTKTVEFHLSNVYRKLGVRSRTQLARTFWAAEQERPSQE